MFGFIRSVGRAKSVTKINLTKIKQKTWVRLTPLNLKFCKFLSRITVLFILLNSYPNNIKRVLMTKACPPMRKFFWPVRGSGQFRMDGRSTKILRVSKFFLKSYPICQFSHWVHFNWPQMTTQQPLMALKRPFKFNFRQLIGQFQISDKSNGVNNWPWTWIRSSR